MKIIKNILFALFLLAAVLFVASCSKDNDEIETSPNVVAQFRIKEEVYPTYTVFISYNAQNQETKRTYSNSLQEMNKEYDGNGFLVKYEEKGIQAPYQSLNQVTTFVRDSQGRELISLKTLANGSRKTKTESFYNASSLLSTTYYEYDFVTLTFKKYRKYVSGYNASGLNTTTLNYDFSIATQDWVLNATNTMSYNGQGQQDSYVNVQTNGY